MIIQLDLLFTILQQVVLFSVVAYNCGHGCHLGIFYLGCIAYADDIAIIAPSKKGIDVMIKVCEEIAADRDNYMNFNGKKSTFMIFKGRHCVKTRYNNIHIGGVNTQDVDETVYLGFKLRAGASYNRPIILPDIAQFWRSVNIFFSEFCHIIYPALQCKLFVQYCCSLYGSMDLETLHVLYLPYAMFLDSNMPYN